MRVFVTATDTNVGKTIACAALHWQFNATQGGSYYKPLQTGALSAQHTDSHTVKKLCVGAHLRITPPRVSLPQPLAPQQAAQQAGMCIDPAWFALPPVEQNIIVEGAGGVMVPITQNFLMIDLMAQWQMPTLVVARAALGTINHTLLTLQALQQRNVPVLGFILNGGQRPADAALIQHYSGVPCVAQWPRCKPNTQQVRRLKIALP